MRRTLRLCVFALVLLGLAGITRAQIQQNVSLIQFKNTSTVAADQFTLTLGGISAADLILDGFYNSDYAAPAVSTDVNGLVHLTWSGGTTPAGQWDSFGYALRGGVQYTQAGGAFLAEQVPVVILPDGFQDWDIITGQPRDTIRNRTPGLLNLTRTAGERLMAPDSFFDIFLELSMPTPPNPVTLESTPIALPAGLSLTYTWDPPSVPTNVYMFYGLSDVSLSETARFHNMATVVPEPSLLLLPLGIGLLIRRRRA